MALELVFILLGGLVIDLTLGDPPSPVHPVSWMGKFISLLVRFGKRKAPAVQFIFGCGVVVLTLSVFVIPVYLLLGYLNGVSAAAFVVTGAVIFKLCFSLRGLRSAALRIKHLLAEDKLSDARFELRSLVGRDTAQLDKSLMVSATVESVAENTCDSFIAPLFYFLIFGVSGAVAYRVINTLDAMIGHHGEFEYLGKFAARLDSVANFIPARITALLIVLAAWVRRENATGAWKMMLRDRNRTESPNAGWTMGAIAGVLGVQLEKVGFYKLGDNNSPLTPNTIDASLQIIMTAAMVWSLMLVAAGVIYHVAA
jgi:adenosylcobinamide-phosphate synthase